MKPQAYTYKNGWSVTAEKGAFYEVRLRNAKGDLVDKVRLDSYSMFLDYVKSFKEIARKGGG